MNLTITPVNMKNSYHSALNTKNNNAQQDFGIKVKLQKLKGENADFTTVSRKRDTVIDIILAKINEITKQQGYNTTKMDTEYYLDFVPRFEHSSKMNCFVRENKSGELLKDKKGLPIFIETRRGQESESAQELVQKLADKNIFA